MDGLGLQGLGVVGFEGLQLRGCVGPSGPQASTCMFQSLSSIFVWGYDGTQYKVRLYPPCGYSILYKE